MRRIRYLLNLSQDELAAIARVSQATVSRWEAGFSEPNRDELARIRAYALRQPGVKWDDAFFFGKIRSAA